MLNGKVEKNVLATGPSIVLLAVEGAGEVAYPACLTLPLAIQLSRRALATIDLNQCACSVADPEHGFWDLGRHRIVAGEKLRAVGGFFIPRLQLELGDARCTAIPTFDLSLTATGLLLWTPSAILPEAAFDEQYVCDLHGKVLWRGR